MTQPYDQVKHNIFFKDKDTRALISSLLLDALLSERNKPEFIYSNMNKVIEIVNNEWDKYASACFGANQADLLWQFLKSENFFESIPEIRDLTIYILSRGAITLLSVYNQDNRLSTFENIRVLLKIIVNPHNDSEKENAIILLKYVMKYTTKNLDNEELADYLAENLDKVYPSVVCYVVEKLDFISQETAEKLTIFLLDYISETKDIVNDFVNEQRSLALEAISFIPKASDNHTQVYDLMEEYLQIDDKTYNLSGLIVAQSVSLNLETIKNYILKFLESKDPSIVFNTVSVLITSSAVWDNDDDCCYYIIDNLNNLLNFGNGKIQDKCIDLLSFADPTSSRITEEIIDTVIEMLATKSPRVYEIAMILINIVFNIRRGTLECGLTLDEFRDKIWDNEQEIMESLKRSHIAQEEFQRVVALLQADVAF